MLARVFVIFIATYRNGEPVLIAAINSTKETCREYMRNTIESEPDLPSADNASKGQLVELHSAMTPHAALRAIVTEILRHLQSNVPGILAGRDAEFLHQARVSLRRLRSAQKTFERILPDTAWPITTVEIKWLATLLGKARDLDVMLWETLPTIKTASSDATDFSPVEKAAQQRRKRLQRQIGSALTSDRYATLLLNLQQWAKAAGTTPAQSSEKLLRFARDSLNK
ncbi:MAG: CHAD domain-containing protein, partial [Spongiibacteraceae bacterium]